MCTCLCAHMIMYMQVCECVIACVCMSLISATGRSLMSYPIGLYFYFLKQGLFLNPKFTNDIRMTNQ